MAVCGCKELCLVVRDFGRLCKVGSGFVEL